MTKAGLFATLPLTSILNACALTSPRKAANTASNDDDPVIILGGGMVGLSAVFYLICAGVACQIHEASGRVCGRSILDFHHKFLCYQASGPRQVRY